MLLPAAIITEQSGWSCKFLKIQYELHWIGGHDAILKWAAFVIWGELVLQIVKFGEMRIAYVITVPWDCAW